MIVEIDPNGVVVLVDLENFKQFSVSDSSNALDAALRSCGAGRVHEDDALISVEWIRTVGRERSMVPTWTAQLEEMLAYADTRGWLKDGGGYIQAHIVDG